jgi:hypothetical protein
MGRNTCPNCGGDYEPLGDPWVHSETGTRKCPLPGRPLPSGFDYRPADEFPELTLSPEARKRVLDKMDSVAEARRRAWETADRTVVGSAPDSAS